MEKKILVLTPNMDLHGGNFVTLSRISDHLANHGYNSELSSPMAFPDQETFVHKVAKENIQLLIGIHAYKTGVFMKNSGLPFILIIGGTDVNAMAEDPKKLKEMSQAVSAASHIVCFSRELKTRVIKLWPDLEDGRMKIIPQGVEIHQLPDRIKGSSIIKRCLHDVYTNNNLPAAFEMDNDGEDPIVFTLVGGMRPVKNPLYLIKTFQDWHERDGRIFFLIVGQMLDVLYTEKELLPAVYSKPGVLFIPGVSISEAHAIVKESFASVNSSDNEGMSLAILESMTLGVPVLARDNPGNLSIVEDDNTGLIFSTPESFVLKAKWLIDNPEDRARITRNAKEFVMFNHSLDVERLAYIDIVSQDLQCISSTEQII